MRGVLAALAVFVTCVAATQAAAHGKPGYTCPPGFNIGSKTPAEALQLPRTQTAINLGLITEEETLAFYDALDKNESGYVCVSLPHGYEQNNRPFGEYFYNFSDDNASKPSS
jgi:hypothetical protein